MAIFKDKIMNDDGYIIENGDWKVADSSTMNVAHIMKARTGDYKQFPSVGVDVLKLLNGSTPASKIKQLIKEQLKADGKKYYNS